MFEFMSSPETIQAATIVLYALVAVVSLIIAYIIFSFKGKNFMDWALALKNISMALLMARIVVVQVTDFDGSPVLKFWQWAFVALAYSLTLYALSREHVFYKNRNIVKSLEKREEQDN